MANRSLILLFLIIALAIPLAGADLSAPSTWHAGFKLWGNFLDMWGENGVRNGTIGGTGNNVTFLDSNGVQFLSRSGTTVDLDMNNKNITNVRIINSTEVNVTTFNATSISGNGSGLFALNGDNITGAPIMRDSNQTILLNTNNTLIRTYNWLMDGIGVRGNESDALWAANETRVRQLENNDTADRNYVNITTPPSVNTSLNLKANKTDIGEFTGGTVADARLSTNVVLENQENHNITIINSTIDMRNVTVNDTGLVLDMRFDENSTGQMAARCTKVYDSSKFANDGTCTGAPNWTSKGLQFNGIDSSVNFVNSSVLNFGLDDSFAIVLFFTTSVTGTSQILVRKQADTGTPRYRLQVTTTNNIEFSIHDGTNEPNIASSLTYTDGNLHVVAAVRDVLSDKLYLYVDGSVVSTTDTTTGTLFNNGLLKIGDSTFNGTFYQVRVYRRLLSPNEVRALYYSNPLNEKSSFIQANSTRIIDDTGKLQGEVNSTKTWFANLTSDSITNLKNNDTYFNGTVFPVSTNFKNDTLLNSIVGLQNNDTSDRSYVNNTFEKLSNKSTNTALGTSDTLYPSQNAVKAYADTKTTLSEVNSTAQINRSQVIGWFMDNTGVRTNISAGTNLSYNSATGVIDINISTFPNNSIPGLQSNDTVHDSAIQGLRNNDTYFNSSTFANSSNFRNDSAVLNSNQSLLLNTNSSIIIKEKIDTCTGASDALGWNGSGMPCRTIPTTNASLSINHSVERSINSSTWVTVKKIEIIKDRASITHNFSFSGRMAGATLDMNLTKNNGTAFYTVTDVSGSNTWSTYNIVFNTSLLRGDVIRMNAKLQAGQETQDNRFCCFNISSIAAPIDDVVLS